jgi:hypothetical protein
MINKFKKIFIGLGAAIIILIFALALNYLHQLSPPPSAYTIKAEPVSRDNKVCIQVTVVGPKVGLNLSLSLDYPNQSEVDATSISEAEMGGGTVTKLLVIEGLIDPEEGEYKWSQPGEYVLKITDVVGKKIYEKKFHFTGANLSIVEVTPTFSKFSANDNTYLMSLNITANDNGDMAIAAYTVHVILDNKNGEGFPDNILFLPGDLKTITTIDPIREGPAQPLVLTPGTYAMSLQLFGWRGSENVEVAATYVTTVRVPA